MKKCEKQDSESAGYAQPRGVGYQPKRCVQRNRSDPATRACLRLVQWSVHDFFCGNV